MPDNSVPIAPNGMRQRDFTAGWDACLEALRSDDRVERGARAFEAVFYEHEPQDAVRPLYPALRAAVNAMTGERS